MSVRANVPRAAAALCSTLLAALFPSTANAQLVKGELFCRATGSEPTLSIVYANGEFMTFTGAMDGLERLARTVPTHLEMKREDIEFGLAFNYNEAFLDKIINYARLDRPSQLPELLNRLAHDTTESPLLVETLQGVVADTVGEFIPLFDKALAPDTDLGTHIQMYQDYVRRGRKVVVVADGVGSLYTNRALYYLENQPAGKHVAMVGVGTVAPEMQGPAAGCGQLGCYVNRTDDRYVQFAPAAAAPNVEGDPDLGGFSHHDFITAYMLDPTVRRAILDRIRDQARTLRRPAMELGEGPMRASLRWAKGADLDLHVFEADRSSHVSYEAPKGRVGTLDRDSRLGGDTPENYTAACGALQEGHYSFEVSFYEGEGPVDAKLELRLGDARYPLERTFYEPLGDGAFRGPEQMASLLLRRIGDGWFYYELLDSNE